MKKLIVTEFKVTAIDYVCEGAESSSVEDIETSLMRGLEEGCTVFVTLTKKARVIDHGKED